MANIQFVKFLGRETLDVALLKHVVGGLRPDTVRPMAGQGPGIVPIAANLEPAWAAVHKHRGVRRRGNQPYEAVDVIFTGPPPYFEDDEWPLEREIEWSKRNVEWLSSIIAPYGIIAGAALHRDESSPHLQLLFIPLHTPDRLGWTHVRDNALKRLGYKRLPKVKKRLSCLQDDYHEKVGKHFGLARGFVGSNRRQEPVDRAKALERRAVVAARQHAAAEAARVEAKEAREEEERKADAAEKRRKSDEKRSLAASARLVSIIEDVDKGQAILTEMYREYPRLIAQIAEADEEKQAAEAAAARARELRAAEEHEALLVKRAKDAEEQALEQVHDEAVDAEIELRRTREENRRLYEGRLSKHYLQPTQFEQEQTERAERAEAELTELRTSYETRTAEASKAQVKVQKVENANKTLQEENGRLVNAILALQWDCLDVVRDLGKAVQERWGLGGWSELLRSHPSIDRFLQAATPAVLFKRYAGKER